MGYRWKVPLKVKSRRHSLKLMDRIEARCEPMPSGCLEWRGAIRHTAGGHGQLRYKGVVYKVHRKYYEMANGVVLPPEVLVMHSCDNPICINLEHLSTGSNWDNTLDKLRKGRGYRQKRTYA